MALILALLCAASALADGERQSIELNLQDAVSGQQSINLDLQDAGQDGGSDTTDSQESNCGNTDARSGTGQGRDTQTNGDYDLVTSRSAEVPGLKAQIEALEGQRSYYKVLVLRRVSGSSKKLAAIESSIRALKSKQAELERRLAKQEAQPLGGDHNQKTFNAWAFMVGYTTRGWTFRIICYAIIGVLGFLILKKLIELAVS